MKGREQRESRCAHILTPTPGWEEVATRRRFGLRYLYMTDRSGIIRTGDCTISSGSLTAKVSHRCGRAQRLFSGGLAETDGNDDRQRHRRGGRAARPFDPEQHRG